VNILLDESEPARLARSLAGHSVTTVQRRGWAGIKNGELLTLTENEFDAFITVDRKLSVQQDLAKLRIPVVLLRSRTNRLENIRSLVLEILEKLPRARAGQLTIIGS
jgi:predicted nuclease of predicted toxin-antitoxin system